jgi:aspartate-semialdehyde dehydrogenase
MSKVPVAILGATGTIGQRFVSLLQDHPWFELALLGSSERKAGGRLEEFWRLEDAPLNPGVAAMELETCDAKALARSGVSAVFCALPSDIAADVETDAARAGIAVFSNASAHRMDPDVPLLVPEVNPDHLALVERQATFRDRGFVVTNPNCSITGLLLGLKPLADALDFDEVHVATYQALSGAGHPGVASLDITGNVLPFIENEEEKMRREAKKIMGAWSDGIVPSDLDVWANCVRVPVREGHLEAVSIELNEDVRGEDVARLLASFRGEPQRQALPTAPKAPILVRPERDRPQPILDGMAGDPPRSRGMAATVGRIRVTGRNLRFFVLSHNTLRGGAGGSVLNAELARRRGYVA